MCSPASLSCRQDKIDLKSVEKGQLGYDSEYLRIEHFDPKLFLEKHDFSRVFSAHRLDITSKAMGNTSAFELVSTMKFFPKLSKLQVCPYTLRSDRTRLTTEERNHIFLASSHFFNSVQTLDLSHNPIDDEMINVLSMMRGLKEVVLRSCKINESTFKKIQESVSVKKMNLGYNALHYPLYKKLLFISEDYFGSNSMLQELVLERSNLSGHLLRGIGSLKRLKRLDIYSNHLPNSAYVHLLNLKSLESLRMGGNKFNKHSIKKVFLGLKTLRSISFDDFEGANDMAREREVRRPFESWHCYPRLTGSKIAVFSRVADEKPWLSFSFLSGEE